MLTFSANLHKFSCKTLVARSALAPAEVGK